MVTNKKEGIVSAPKRSKTVSTVSVYSYEEISTLNLCVTIRRVKFFKKPLRKGLKCTNLTHIAI